MAEFANPFCTMVPERKMTDTELARSIRANIAAEMEAIHLYQGHAEATDNELAKKVLLDIADEERVHVGEFQKLLKILVDDEEALLEKGSAEVTEMEKELLIK
jgi:rubrerythrin